MAIFKKGKKSQARREGDASEWEKADAEYEKAEEERKKKHAGTVGKIGEIVLYELKDGRNKGGVRPALVLGEKKPVERGDPSPEQIALERQAIDKEGAKPDAEGKEASKLTPDEQAAERIRKRWAEEDEKRPKQTLLQVFLYPPEDFGASIDLASGKETNFLWATAEAGDPGDGGKWFPLGTEIPEPEEGSGEKDRYGRVVNKAREVERYPGEGNRDVVDNPSGSSGGGFAP
jgi:hypothetical protein